LLQALSLLPITIPCPKPLPKNKFRRSSQLSGRRHAGPAKLASESIELARQVKELGVDLIDCSSGGNVAQAKIPVGPGYQTAFAERIRRESGVMTGALGMITSAVQAEHILATGQADAVVIAREMLLDPYWPLRAARELGQAISWPVQYLRAGPEGAQSRVPVDLKNLKSCFEEQHAVPQL
jgi:2,4-dienoyl-CoA reductase-like NADH-dependent reductase (Old Yellow Enzyme family)